MKSKRSIVHYSLLAALLVGVPCVADAALRIDNHSRGYAAGNAQTAPSVRSQMTPGNSNAVMGTVAAVPADTVQNTAPAQTNNIATVPANENSLSATASHECPLIYPNGEIMWGTPTIGAGIGGADTCVAVVELVGYQAAKDGRDLVLARANMALGDTIKCNISSFPEATMYANAVESFYFPSDNPPSMDDVVAQMNREQKQNAGLKIAAGAVIGGLGGNMAGDGNGDSLLGTDKGKIQGTVIGALSGAALMAGNAYAGKVAGDVILSTGVNAAAGGVVGNMVQTGDSVLRIEDCVIPDQNAENGERKTTCLWGALAITDNGLGSGETAYYRIDDTSGATYVCSVTGEKTTCESERLVNIIIDGRDVSDTDASELAQMSRTVYYMHRDEDTDEITFDQNQDITNGTWVKIYSAKRITSEIPAMIEMRDKAFGFTDDDWEEWKAANGAETVYGRGNNGIVYTLDNADNAKVQNFYPMEVSASDGGVIDFGNKARLKNTLIGAGVGGALGGFTAYQGAQLDVQNRWTTAMREYEDSLSTVFCRTGSRWLSRYNDSVFIPSSLATVE